MTANPEGRDTSIIADPGTCKFCNIETLTVWKAAQPFCIIHKVETTSCFIVDFIVSYFKHLEQNSVAVNHAFIEMAHLNCVFQSIILLRIFQAYQLFVQLNHVHKFVFPLLLDNFWWTICYLVVISEIN